MSDMSEKREDANGLSGKLLEPQERLICEQIATGEPPHNQRAQALLAIDKGETQAEAGRLSRLSAGQVKYWLGKFRKDRMNIFPSESAEIDQQLDEDAKTVKTSKKGKTPKKAKKKDKKGKKKKAKKKDKKGKKKKAKKSKKRKKKPKKK